MGLILINPVLALFGLVAGTGLGSVIGSLKAVGVDENFINDLGSHLKPGASKLFIVAKKAKPEAILQELKRFSGKVFQTSLKHDDEDKLRAALEAVKLNTKTEQGQAK